MKRCFIKHLFVFGIIYNVIELHASEDTRTFSKERSNYEVMKLNPNMKENREELKRIIKVLNGHFENEEKMVENDLINELHYRDPKITDDAQVDDQVSQIRKLLSLLQKNYDYQVRYNKEIKRPKSRIYYIENPEVIEAFKSNLRSKDQSTSSGSSEDSRFDRSTRDNLLNYRREVPFNEFNLASSENLQVETNIQENNYDAIQFPNNLFDGALRNQNELVNLQPKGRFKIAKDKRKEEKNEKKRKKTADGRGKKKKPSMELIEESHENLKKIRYETREKKQKKPRPSSREIDIVEDLTRDTDKKIFNSGEWKDTSRYNDSVNQARRPKKLYGKKSKFSERVIGRTFIPFIGKKTVYEEDK